MPDFLAPGVYIEEPPDPPAPIEGVDVRAAGFVGPCHAGPVGGPPALLTSLAAFERLHGGGAPLDFGGAGRAPHHLWHAVRSFFEEGGRRLYVSRVGQAAGQGQVRPDSAAYAQALQALEDVDGIALVAAPGAAALAPDGAAAALDSARLLIAHAERLRHRIALIDPAEGLDPQGVAALRAALDSSRAALYYPWVTSVDAATGRPLNLPPSGFVAGVLARADGRQGGRGLLQAPASEVLRGALGFERTLDKTWLDRLQQEGINVLRTLPGRGHRVWGGRTLSHDPAWKYVGLRRYVGYLERSIERGTRWAVFEPNAAPLWARLRAAIEDFLQREWAAGALLGSQPAQAFFVRCDATTMTPSDLDEGRLVALVGVAPLRPAEFITLRLVLATAGGRG